MNLKARIEKLEKRLNGEDTLQVILPDYLQDDDYKPPVRSNKVIRPSGFLALDENGEVYFHES